MIRRILAASLALGFSLNGTAVAFAQATDTMTYGDTLRKNTKTQLVSAKAKASPAKRAMHARGRSMKKRRAAR